MYLVHLALAGVWNYVFHWGTGVALIVLCVFAAYGTRLIAGIPLVGGILSATLAPLRKDLLWVAFGIAVFMGGMYVGDKDGTSRCVAKENVVSTTVHKAVKKAITQPRADKWDTDQ